MCHHPSLILGPSLDGEFSTSGEPIRKLLKREIPGVSRINFFTVDVRDVAAAHIKAMTTPEAAGQRFICLEGAHRYREIALILQQHFGHYRIPTTEFPDFVVRLVALMDKTVRLSLDSLGKEYSYSSEQARKVLGWNPRPLEQSVIEMAESMVRQGVV